MPESVIDLLKRQLDLESESPEVVRLPADFYSKIAVYAQRLRRSAGAGGSEASLRLISVQSELIGSMGRDLVEARVGKALRRGSRTNLLPEERHMCLPREAFRQRFDTFLSALSEGRPSLIERARKSEEGRMVLVKFTKDVGEVIGFDLKRYGPFSAEDVASISAATAEALVSSGSAVELTPGDPVYE